MSYENLCTSSSAIPANAVPAINPPLRFIQDGGCLVDTVNGMVNACNLPARPTAITVDRFNPRILFSRVYLAPSPKPVVDSYTLVETDEFLLVSGGGTINLPNLAAGSNLDCTTKVFFIKNTSETVGLTLNPVGGANLDGQPNPVVLPIRAGVILIYDDSGSGNYHILGNYP